MPIHIEGEVAPVLSWIANVSQRNAPGAISAIAFIVNPVSPRVAFISGADVSAMILLFPQCCASGLFLGPKKRDKPQCERALILRDHHASAPVIERPVGRVAAVLQA